MALGLRFPRFRGQFRLPRIQRESMKKSTEIPQLPFVAAFAVSQFHWNRRGTKNLQLT